MPVKNIKIQKFNSANIIDADYYIYSSDSPTFRCLDQSSCLWVVPTSSHVAFFPDYKFKSLVTNNMGALDGSSYLWTWGENATGQLGVGTTITSSIPQSVIGNRQWIAAYGYTGNYIALNSNSYAWAWGANTSGQLGNNQGVPLSSPVSVVGGKQWRQICINICNLLANTRTVVALDINSYAWAWGKNDKGQLGDNSIIDKSSPVSVVGGRQFTVIYNTNKNDSTAIFALDKSSYVWAWGYNSGQLGDNQIFSVSSPTSVVGGRQFTSICPNYFNVFALDGLSYAWAWGRNYSGELGDNTILNKSSPISVIGGGQWTNIHTTYTATIFVTPKAAFPFYTGTLFGLPSVSIPTLLPYPLPSIKKFFSYFSDYFFLDTASTVWGWGYNNTGGLGKNNTSSYVFPTRLLPKYAFSLRDNPPNFIKITAGSGVSNTPVVYIMDQSSYLWGWGSTAAGQLGYYQTGVTFESIAKTITGNRQWKYVTTCSTTTIALDASSYAWAWGGNTYGQLGNNTTTNMSSPISVWGGRQWLNILSCGDSTYGIDSSSYVWAWGVNNSGQLGDNTIINKSSPISVIGAKRALKIAACFTNTSLSAAMLDTNSYAWCWGKNTSTGQLGDNTLINKSSPVSVVGGKQWRNIFGYYNSFCAFDASSYAWCWGGNNSGQLGDNTIINKSSPVSVVGGKQLVTSNVLPSSSFMVALNNSSYAWVWGYNGYGVMGIGLGVNRSSPVSVIGAYQFKYLEADSLGMIGMLASSSQYVVTGVDYFNRVGIFGSGGGVLSISSPLVVNPTHQGYQYNPIIKNLLER